MPPSNFYSLSIVAEINADVKKNPRNNKVMKDKLWYTGNKGTCTDAGVLMKRKTDKNMNKIIDRIWFDFSEAVGGREIKQWIEAIESEFQGKVERFEDMLDQVEQVQNTADKNEQKGILLTDKTALCMNAKEKEIPYILYLNEENKGADFADIPYAVEGFKGVDVAFLDEIYRRFKGIPWTILETGRLLVRETTEEDLDALYEVYADPSISLYTENLYEDRDEERAYIRDYIKHVYAFCGYGIWSVIHKESGKLIGRAGLACREGYETPELGYVIGVSYQRQGYATEVCRAIMEYAGERLGFPKIRAVFEPENLASAKLCEKLGFIEEGQVQLDGKNMLQYVYKGTVNYEKD